MQRLLMILIFSLFIKACHQEPPKVLKLNFDKNNFTVSGISSGGYMAHQLHVAHSDKINGVGLFASGAYGCAQGDLNVALEKCIGGVKNQSFQLLIDYVSKAAKSKAIAPLSNIDNDKVWIFHGLADSTVTRAKVDQLIKWYQNFKAKTNSNLDLLSGHGIPTINYGVACEASKSPFINNCDFDGAGKLFDFLYSDLKAKSPFIKENLYSLEQNHYLIDGQKNTLADKGFIYVPTNCQKGSQCKLHVVFHGCSQNYQAIDDKFVKDAGFNEWAEANNIITFYPQTRSSMFPLNPKACWDWWGYTDSNYDNRQGVQIQHIMQMIEGLALN